MSKRDLLNSSEIDSLYSELRNDVSGVCNRSSSVSLSDGELVDFDLNMYSDVVLTFRIINGYIWRGSTYDNCIRRLYLMDYWCRVLLRRIVSGMPVLGELIYRNYSNFMRIRKQCHLTFIDVNGECGVFYPIREKQYIFRRIWSKRSRRYVYEISESGRNSSLSLVDIKQNRENGLNNGVLGLRSYESLKTLNISNTANTLASASDVLLNEDTQLSGNKVQPQLQSQIQPLICDTQVKHNIAKCSLSYVSNRCKWSRVSLMSWSEYRERRERNRALDYARSCDIESRDASFILEMESYGLRKYGSIEGLIYHLIYDVYYLMDFYRECLEAGVISSSIPPKIFHKMLTSYFPIKTLNMSESRKRVRELNGSSSRITMHITRAGALWLEAWLKKNHSRLKRHINLYCNREVKDKSFFVMGYGSSLAKLALEYKDLFKPIGKKEELNEADLAYDLLEFNKKLSLIRIEKSTE